jgi:hypothetical protein
MTTPSWWRLGVDLIRLCLVFGGLTALIATQAGSGECRGRSAVGCERSGIASPATSARLQAAAALPNGHDRSTPPRHMPARDADEGDGSRGDVVAPHAVPAAATPVASWRVTRLGIDPSIFLTPSAHPLRAPPR